MRVSTTRSTSSASPTRPRGRSSSSTPTASRRSSSRVTRSRRSSSRRRRGQNYYPEWITNGAGLTDVEQFARLWDQEEIQWSLWGHEPARRRREDPRAEGRRDDHVQEGDRDGYPAGGAGRVLRAACGSSASCRRSGPETSRRRTWLRRSGGCRRAAPRTSRSATRRTSTAPTGSREATTTPRSTTCARSTGCARASVG